MTSDRPRTRSRPAPIPDALTGEPRPPTARRGEAREHWVTAPEDLQKSVVPLEYGPALEAYEEPLRMKIGLAVTLFVFALLVFVIPFRGFDWMSMWWPQVMIIGLPILQFRKSLGDRVLAGALWVQQRDKWALTYELVKIRSTTVGRYRAIKIVDCQDHEIILVLHDAQTNPRLWDLVYNGILHSVASGNCDISRAARRILKV